MPELPEAETVRSTLEPFISGSQFKETRIFLPKMIKNQSPAEFIYRTKGCICQSVQRRGKNIVVHVTNNDQTYFIIIHLGMTGAIFCVPDVTEIPAKYQKHLHVLFKLDSGLFFAFTDIRTFGSIRVLSESEYSSFHFNKSILHLGPEVFWDHGMDLFLKNLEKKSNIAIKTALLDQTVVAGIGNIYACEVLHDQKIHPLTAISLLSLDKRKEIFDSIKTMFLFSISVGGSSISDYVDARGQKGRFQHYFKVYNQKKCGSCHHEIENIKIRGQSSFFCPRCQPVITSIF